MKGDFTRSTFDPAKGYTSVRMQQGRVQLDADWNEQADIHDHLRRTGLNDVLGPSGVPRERADGFQVRANGDGIEITPGRIWVGGTLCEAPAEVPVDDLPATDGTYLVYLDVWQRHVGAAEDPAIREPALGGPDTATRVQTLFRARFAPVAADATCPELADWTDAAATSGRMAARFAPGGLDADDPCEVPADTAYAGLENHLYRIEIHDGGTVGDPDEPTFKWSRDNGAVVAPWIGSDGLEVAIPGQRQDDGGFHDPPFWIELSDDDDDFAGRTGRLAEAVERTEGPGGETVLVLADGESPVDAPDAQSHPRVRRWDSEALPITGGSWHDLEHGVQVKFTTDTYRSGDYWLVPARAFIGDFAGAIEWPTDDAGEPVEAAPHGVPRGAARLAVVEIVNGAVSVVDGQPAIEDCRRVFSPLVEQTRFLMAGGDGQAGVPREKLPCMLRVAALEGHHPIAGARVRFSVVAGGGVLGANGSSGETVETATDADGVAVCSWTLPSEAAPFVGDSRQCLLVTARLLGDLGAEIASPLVFTADLRVASQVAFTPYENCEALTGVSDVETAINELCVANGGGRRALVDANFSNLPNGYHQNIPLNFRPKYVWATVAAAADMPARYGTTSLGYADFTGGVITQRCPTIRLLGPNPGSDQTYRMFPYPELTIDYTLAEPVIVPHLASVRIINLAPSPDQDELFRLDVTTLTENSIGITLERRRPYTSRDPLPKFALQVYLVIFG